MQMHETQQVKEVYSSQEANRLLQQGWTLITVIATSSPQKLDATIPCYVFGQKAPAP